MSVSSLTDLKSSELLKDISPAKAIGVIVGFILCGVLVLGLLLLSHGTGNTTADIVQSLPALNAFFNAVSAVLLLFGYRAIRRKQYTVHMKFNLTALCTSILFLIGYLTYYSIAGDTHFPGQGAVKYFYFTILISHIILSIILVPLVLSSFYLALSGKFKIHRKVSKFTLPVWLYVSVTGVLIYFMLSAYTGMI